jgi:large subunit ribosomal protein L24
VQTTLLGFAIAVILALVTALVGPFFVDWGRYRGEFETRASRLTGLEFRVTGSIDARLLPTPTLMLQGIEFNRPGDSSQVRARSLRIEFALGSLVRGEWRIADARLEGPEFTAGLDSAGRFAWPAPSMAFEPEGVSIQRLNIEDGRAILADAASGARLALDKIEFKGEVRSLAGPVKGEGSFVVAGHHYPYRLGLSRVADDGGIKLRLTVDPIDRPLTADADISIWADRGAPRYEGSLTLARAVGRAAEGGLIESWRVTSRVKGDGAAAVLEQIEFQYGPDERAIKLRGDAKLTFGSQPQVNGVLSSPQLDLDRMLALPEETRRRPLVAIKTLVESFSGAQKLPFPVKLGLGVDTVTLAGATLQRVSGDIKTDGETWDIETLDLRAPGITQVRLSGRFGATPKGVAFEGPAKVDSGDPRALLAWLTDRVDPQAVAAGSLRLSGDVVLGSETIAVDRLKAEIDRMTVLGRFAYSWNGNDRPARLDAALTAPEIDLDRVQALARAILGDTEFDRPREGTLSLKVDRAVLAGIEAKRADVSMRLDANGLGIERLTIADFGGATLAVKGRIDTQSQSPRGALTVDLDARALDGVLALTDKFAPQASDQLRRLAERVTPVTVRATISVDSGAAPSSNAAARFKIDGRAGGFRLALQGDAGAASDAFTIDNLAALRAAKVKFAGRIDAEDGGALAELVRLDRLIAVDKRPGRLNLNANGPLDGNLVVDGQLVAGPLNVSASGMLRLANGQGPSARLDLKVANASLRSPRPVAARRPAELLPVSATARLALSEGTVSLSDISGTIAGTSIGGRLAVGLQQPMRIDGDIELAAIELPAALAAAIGTPVQQTNAAPWSGEPFEPHLASGLSGQVKIKSARVMLTPKLAARDVRGVLKLDGPELALADIDGALAGGRIAGGLTFLRRAEGLTARAQLKLAGANLVELLPGDGQPSIAGRLTLDLTAEGTGLSPIALIGSLGGGGSFTFENGRLARLDPAAFAAVIRAIDQGLPIDTTRVRERMDVALASGVLPVTLAEGAITVTAGQTRLSSATVRAANADLAVSGNLNLADGALDARLILFGTAGADAPSNTRPEVMIALKGPLDAPKRTIDVAALASWLALRAVEQQSKKLDVLEGREPPPSPPKSEAAPAVPASPAGALPEAAPSTASDTPTPRARPTEFRSPSVNGQPNGAARAKPPTAPAAGQLAPLPPPVDIRPAPGSRTRALNGPAQGAVRLPQPSPPKPLAITPPLGGRVGELN